MTIIVTTDNSDCDGGDHALIAKSLFDKHMFPSGRTSARSGKPYTKHDGTEWTEDEMARFKAAWANPKPGRIRIGPNFEFLGVEEPPTRWQKLVRVIREAFKEKQKPTIVHHSSRQQGE